VSVATMILAPVILLSILGGTNFYIARRIYQWLNIFLLNINTKIYIVIYIFIVLIMILGFMQAFLPFPLTIKKILNWISIHWMGIFLFLLMFFIIADFTLLLGSIVKIIPRPIPQIVRFYAGLLVLLLTTGFVSYGIYNAKQIKHVSYNIQLKKTSLDNLKIVLISDSHFGSINHLEKNLERVVQEINNLNPDIVCLTGDIFNDDYNAIRKPEKVISLLKSIDSTYGVYACLGNHDGGRTLNQMIDLLQKSNIKLLKDEYEIIDDRLVLIGRLDPRPIGGANGFVRSNIENILASVDANMPVIVMDHSPSNIGEYGKEIDLILTEHTHKGQIFPGNLITKAMFVVDYGHYQKDAESPHVIVTSGISTWGPPIRVGTYNEIVNITLR